MSFYGPLPPPPTESESTGEQQDNDHKKEDISSSYGPSLPPDMTDQSHNTYGPQLPSSHLLPKDQYGPSLPKDQYGPSLPKDQYGPSLPKDQYSPSLPPTDQYGPSVSSIASRHDDPSNLINTGSTVQEDQSVAGDHDTMIIGPLPPSLSADSSQLCERDTRKREIEERTRQMKDKLDQKDKGGSSKAVREEWMMELPPEVNPNVYATSMTSRKFRTKYTEVGDRSVWTDTPADKARKAMEGNKKQKTSNEEELTSKRDQLLAQEVDQYNKQHRNKSLVDMHRKRKAETQSVEGDKERRPFDRDIDLQLPQNIMTDAKRRTLIKDSAKSLDSKFARGKQQFL